MTTLKEFEQLFFSRTLIGPSMAVMVISDGYGAAHHRQNMDIVIGQSIICFPCFESSHGPSKGDCYVKLSEVSDRTHQDSKPKEPKNGGIAEKAK